MSPLRRRALAAAFVIAGTACSHLRDERGSMVLEQLIEESKHHKTAMESTTLPTLQLSAADARALAGYAIAHPDETAYHVLIGLRRAAPDEYRRVPISAKAAILCAALATQTFLNDWGYLDPKESHDGDSAQALLELRDAAVSCLIPLLDDRRQAPLFGSEDATMSNLFRYRRSDFAYRYLSQILGLKPVFDPDPGQRDSEIARLKKRVAQG